jgi:uncharacterized protein YeaO (DUF488 family)
MKIFIKRAYEDATAADGYRALVDRVWPRGRSKETLALDEWAKELGPSTKLRQWFGHDPRRWESFEQRYRKELASPAQRERMRLLLDAVGKRPLTLVYGAKDEVHNQAVVLRDLLSQMTRHG